MNNQQIMRIVQMVLRRRGGKSSKLVLTIVGLLVAYVLLQPFLSRRFGVSLPGFENGGTVRQTDEAVAVTSTGTNTPQFGDLQVPDITLTSPTGATSSSSTTTTSRAPSNSNAFPSANATGTLRELGNGVLQSPAGLVYTRGSQEGHRIKHVMAHSQDAPNRPGSHGVFDANDQVDVVALIDEAYELAQSNTRTRTTKEEGRAVHTVDMGRRIGFVGGESGNRRRKPAAKHMRLVLEGDRVITAYPLIP